MESQTYNPEDVSVTSLPLVKSITKIDSDEMKFSPKNGNDVSSKHPLTDKSSQENGGKTGEVFEGRPQEIYQESSQACTEIEKQTKIHPEGYNIQKIPELNSINDSEIMNDMAESNLHPTATVDRVEDNIQKVHLEEQIPEEESQSKFLISDIVTDEKVQEILKQQTLQEEEKAAIATTKSCRQEKEPEMTAIIDKAIDQPETTSNITAQSEHVEHQSEASATEIIIVEHINEERKVTTDISTSPDVDEVEKIPALHSASNSEMMGGSKILADEATDIKEATNVEIQQSNIESVAEDIAQSNLYPIAAVERVENIVQEEYSIEEIHEDEIIASLSSIPPVRTETVDESIAEQLKNEAKTIVIETEEEQKPVSPSAKVGKLEKVPLSHTRDTLEINDGEEVKQDEARKGEAASEIQPLKTATESALEYKVISGIPDDKAILGLSTITPASVETFEGSTVEELINVVKSVVIHNEEEHKPISRSTKELENDPFSPTREILKINDGNEVKQEEASKEEEAIEFQLLKTATASSKEKDILGLSTIPPVTVETVEESIVDELRNEAQSEVTETVVDQKPLNPIINIEEPEKDTVQQKRAILEINEGNEIIQEKTREEEATIEIQPLKTATEIKQEEARDEEVVIEFQPLKNATESTSLENDISGLSTIPPVTVETVKESVADEHRIEAQSGVIETDVEQKSINPIEEPENDNVQHNRAILEINDANEVIQEETKEEEAIIEIKPLTTATKSTLVDKTISGLSTITPVGVETVEESIAEKISNEAKLEEIDTEEEQKQISPSTDVEELGKDLVSHTNEILEINDGNEFKQEEARDEEVAIEFQPLKTATESTSEEKDISGLSIVPPVTVETVEENVADEHRIEAQSEVMETEVEQKSINPITNIEEPENDIVQHNRAILEINDANVVIQEEAIEEEATIEIQPLTTAAESTPDDKEISGLSTITLVDVDTVEESIAEKLSNEAKLEEIDTEEEQKQISPSTDVEELEKDLVSHTRVILEINDGNAFKQEEEWDEEVAIEFQPLKTATESTSEEKDILGLSIVPPVTVETVEETVADEHRIEAQSEVMETEVEQKSINPITNIEEPENDIVHHNRAILEINDANVVIQEEAIEEEATIEIQPLTTAAESTPDDKEISGLSTITLVDVDTVEESIAEKLSNEAKLEEIDTEEEQKQISPSTDVEELEKDLVSHTRVILEINDGNAFKQEEEWDEEVAIEFQPLKTATESTSEEKDILGLSIVPPVTVETVEETVADEHRIEAQSEVMETEVEQKSINPITNIEEPENDIVHHNRAILEINDANVVIQEEAIEEEATIEIQPLTTAAESTPDDKEISGLSTITLVDVDTVEESIAEKLSNEAKLEEIDTEEEQKQISPSTDVEELEKDLVSHTRVILEINDGNAFKQEEEWDEEVAIEFQPLKTATEDTSEEKDISGLSIVAPVTVETLEESVAGEHRNEAQSEVIGTKVEQKSINPITNIEEPENDTIQHNRAILEINDANELIQEEAKEEEAIIEIQPLTTATESTPDDKEISGLSIITLVGVETAEESIAGKHSNEAKLEEIDTEEEQKQISPSTDVEELEKDLFSHTRVILEINDGNAVKQAEARDEEVAIEFQPLKTATEDTPEEKDISGLSIVPPVTIETVEESVADEYRIEAQSKVIETEVEQKSINTITNIEEPENDTVQHNRTILEINDANEVKQEKTKEEEATIEVQPLTAIESIPDDKAFSGLSTITLVGVETVGESTAKKLSNEAKLEEIDTKEEQKQISQSADVEELEKDLVSHTREIMEINNENVVKQEDTREKEVAIEFQQLKTATEDTSEEKDISGLSIVAPVTVETLEESVAGEHRNEAQSEVIGTKVEQKSINPITNIEEPENDTIQHNRAILEINDANELIQEEAKEEEAIIEIQPLTTATESTPDDKEISGLSIITLVGVETAEESIAGKHSNEAKLEEIDTEEEQKQISPSTDVEELEKDLFSHTRVILEINDGNAVKQAEARDEEVAIEFQPLKTATEDTPEEKDISGLSIVPPVTIETVEESVADEYRIEAQSKVIETEVEQKSINTITNIEEPENDTVQHNRTILEINDANEVKQEKTKEEEATIEVQPLTAIESIPDDKAFSGLSTITLVGVETVGESTAKKLSNEAKLEEIDTKEEQKQISQSADVEELEKDLVSHTREIMEINNENVVKQEDTREKEVAIEFQQLKTATEDTSEEKDISGLSIVPPVTVETVEESVADEHRNEAQSEVIVTKVEQKSKNPITNIEEPENDTVQHNRAILEINDANELIQEEAKEEEAIIEIQPLTTATESTPDDKAIPGLSTITLVGVETVGESITGKLSNGAKLEEADTKEEQKQISQSADVEELEKDLVSHTREILEINYGNAVKQEEERDEEVAIEFQPLKTDTEVEESFEEELSNEAKLVEIETEEEQKQISPSTDIEELEKDLLSNTREKQEINDVNAVKQEEARDEEVAIEFQPLKIATKGTSEEKDISSLSTITHVGVVTVEESFVEELSNEAKLVKIDNECTSEEKDILSLSTVQPVNVETMEESVADEQRIEAQSEVIETEVEQKSINPITNIEEPENDTVQHNRTILEITDANEVTQEEARDEEATIEIQPLTSATEITPDDIAIKGLSTVTRVGVETVEESIVEKLSNEAKLEEIDTKEEQKQISPSTDVEELEKDLVSHTREILDINDVNVVKQEEARDEEVAIEFHPLKIATEGTSEEKDISGLSTITHGVVTVEESFVEELSNEAKLVEVDTEEEQKQISPSTDVEELEKDLISHTREILEINDVNAVKQKEARDEEVAIEFQPLKSATEGVSEEKDISGLSSIPPVTVETVEESVTDEQRIEDQSEVIETKVEQKSINPFTNIEEPENDTVQHNRTILEITDANEVTQEEAREEEATVEIQPLTTATESTFEDKTISGLSTVTRVGVETVEESIAEKLSNEAKLEEIDTKEEQKQISPSTNVEELEKDIVSHTREILEINDINTVKQKEARDEEVAIEFQPLKSATEGVSEEKDISGLSSIPPVTVETVEESVTDEQRIEDQSEVIETEVEQKSINPFTNIEEPENDTVQHNRTILEITDATEVTQEEAREEEATVEIQPLTTATESTFEDKTISGLSTVTRVGVETVEESIAEKLSNEAKLEEIDTKEEQKQISPSTDVEELEKDLVSHTREILDINDANVVKQEKARDEEVAIESQPLKIAIEGASEEKDISGLCSIPPVTVENVEESVADEHRIEAQSEVIETEVEQKSINLITNIEEPENDTVQQNRAILEINDANEVTQEAKKDEATIEIQPLTTATKSTTDDKAISGLTTITLVGVETIEESIAVKLSNEANLKETDTKEEQKQISQSADVEELEKDLISHTREILDIKAVNAIKQEEARDEEVATEFQPLKTATEGTSEEKDISGLSTIPPVTVETVEESVADEQRIEAQSEVIETEVEQKSINPITNIEEPENDTVQHNRTILEITDANEVTQEEAREEELTIEIQPLTTATESTPDDKAISGLSTVTRVGVETVEESIAEKLSNEAKLEEIDTKEEQKQISPSTDVEELEKDLISHTRKILDINDGNVIKQEEARDEEVAIEFQPLKIATEGASEEKDISGLSSIPPVTVETVEERVADEQRIEAQSEVIETDVEQKSINPITNNKEPENDTVQQNRAKLEINDANEVTTEAKKDEATIEIQPLTTATESTSDDKAISGLTTITLVGVETVEESIVVKLSNEAKLEETGTKEEQKQISQSADVEELEKDLVSFTREILDIKAVNAVKQEEARDEEVAIEFQPLKTATEGTSEEKDISGLSTVPLVTVETVEESVVDEHRIEAQPEVIETEVEQKSINPITNTEEPENDTVQHNRSTLEITDANEVTQEEAREDEATIEIQPLTTATESTPVDKAIPGLTTITPIGVETVEESIVEELSNEAKLEEIDTKEEQKKISQSADVEEPEKDLISHTKEILEINDVNAVEQEETRDEAVAIEFQPLKTATEVTSEEKDILGLSTIPLVIVETVEESVADEHRIEAESEVIETEVEQKSINPITNIEEPENAILQHIRAILEINDANEVKQEEAREEEATIEIQSLTTATESTPDDKAISGLSTITPVGVETVEESIAVKLSNEAKLEEIDTKEEQKQISQSADVEELEKDLVSRTKEILEINDVNSVKQEEARGEAVAIEFQPLKTDTEGTSEEKDISDLSTVPPATVEIVEESVADEHRIEAQSGVIEIEVEQKSINPIINIEEPENATVQQNKAILEINDANEVIQEEAKEEEATIEIQPLTTTTESTHDDKVISGLSTITPIGIETIEESMAEKLSNEAKLEKIDTKEKQKQIRQSADVEELEKDLVLHTTEILEINDGNAVKQEKARDEEVAIEFQPLKTGTYEEKDISGLSIVPPVTVEIVEESVADEHRIEAQSRVIETEVEQKSINPITNIEEPENTIVQQNKAILEINDANEVIQEDAKEEEATIEIQPLTTTTESLSTITLVGVETVEESIEEELSNEAKPIEIDTKKEQKPISPSTDVEALEKDLVSHTREMLEINDINAIKQEEARDVEISIEFQPLKTAIEKKSISGLSTIPPLTIETVEESVADELRNEALSGVIETEVEQKPVNTITNIEEPGKDTLSHNRTILESNDGNEFKQEEEATIEIQPLENPTESTHDDKTISGLSTITPVSVEKVEESTAEELINEAKLVEIDNKEEKSISPSTHVGELEIDPVPHTREILEINDGNKVKQEEASDEEEFEFQPLKTAIEMTGTFEEKDISCLSTIPPVTVDTVEESIADELRNEAQSRVIEIEMIQKLVNPITKIEEPKKDTVQHNIAIFEIDGGNEVIQEEDREEEATIEIQSLKTNTKSIPNDKATSCLSTITPIGVETVEKSIAEKHRNEAKSVEIDTEEEQKEISPNVEELVKDPVPYTSKILKINDGNVVKQEEARVEEEAIEFQPLKTTTESFSEEKEISGLSTMPLVTVKTVEESIADELRNEAQSGVTETDMEPLNQITNIEEPVKDIVQHNRAIHEINDGNEVIQEDARKEEATIEIQPLKIATKSTPDDKAISGLSTITPVGVETVEESTVEELKNEDQSVLIDTEEDQKPITLSIDVEELEKDHVPHTREILEINDGNVVKQEEAWNQEVAIEFQALKITTESFEEKDISLLCTIPHVSVDIVEESIAEELRNEARSIVIGTEVQEKPVNRSTNIEELIQEEAREEEATIEIQPLKTVMKSTPDDKSISGFSTITPVSVEIVEESTAEEHKNDAKSEVIDSKQEQTAISLNTDIEELENDPISHTKEILEINYGNEVKQEEVREEEVVEESIAEELKNEVESIVIDIEEEPKLISSSTDVEKLENDPISNKRDILEINIGNEVIQEEAKEEETTIEIQPLETATESTLDDKVISDLSTLSHANVETVEERTPEKPKIEAESTVIDNKNEHKPVSLSIDVEELEWDLDGQSDTHESTKTNISEDPVEKIPGSSYPCKNREPYFDSEAHKQTNEQLPKTKEQSSNNVDEISEFENHIRGQKLKHEHSKPQVDGEHQFITPLNVEPISAVHDKVDRADGSENIEEEPTYLGESLSYIQVSFHGEDTVNQVQDHDNNNSKATDSKEKTVITYQSLEIDPTKREDSEEAIKQENLENQEAEINQVCTEKEEEKQRDDSIVMVEGSRDTEEKGSHKKSHGILSGVGSKVKHSISKVKKAITGKSSHSKAHSPK